MALRLDEERGLVSVGIDTIRRHLRSTVFGDGGDDGRRVYLRARTLLITADSGGSNGARTRLWKWELQKLATESGLSISVRHLPPGTSKWNRSSTGCSRHQQELERTAIDESAVIVNLIAATRTRTGLRVRCELDPGRYPEGGRSQTRRCPASTSHASDSRRLELQIHPEDASRDESFVF